MRKTWKCDFLLGLKGSDWWKKMRISDEKIDVLFYFVEVQSRSCQKQSNGNLGEKVKLTRLFHWSFHLAWRWWWQWWWWWWPGCAVGDSSLLGKLILLRVAARSTRVRHPGWIVFISIPSHVVLFHRLLVGWYRIILKGWSIVRVIHCWYVLLSILVLWYYQEQERQHAFICSPDYFLIQI